MALRTPERSGYSLAELVVVIAITTILVGLILGAIQKVRAAAARTACQNNLRQLGTALHHHHAARHRLPVGVTGENNLKEPYPYLTWMVRLLPHLEQGDLWRQTQQAYRQNRDFQADPPHDPRRIPLAAFACPSDGRTATPAVFPTPQRDYLYGLTSYLGVEGRNAVRTDGLLYLDSAHRFADVADGTSNTLLVGERPPSRDLRFGWWYAGKGMTDNGEADAVLGARTFCRRDSYCGSCGSDPLGFRPGKIDDPCAFLHFWSPHPGGAHFLFADGSVRFLHYSADPVLPALASRAGGESVAIPD